MNGIRIDQPSGMVRVLLVVLGVGVFAQLCGLLFNNDGSRYATQLYLGLFLPALLLLVGLRLAPTFWRQIPAITFLILIGWVLLATQFEGSRDELGRTFKIVTLIALYLFAVGSLVRSERYFHTVLLVAVAVAALFAWLTLYYQFGILDKPMDYSQFRWKRLRELGWEGYADLRHPIVAGLYYGTFAVMLTFIFARFKLRLWQLALVAFAMLGLVAYVFFTFSRGAWFAMGAGGFVLLVIFNSRKTWSVIGTVAVLLLAGAYLFWPEIQAERQIGVNGRDLIWAEWLRRFPEFWLSGAGSGAEFKFRFPSGFTVFHSHSLYLQLWYEYGLPGVILFALFIGSLFWKGWKCRAQPIAKLGVALLVFAMVAMVSDIYAIFLRPNPYWVVFWFPVGILLGVRPKDDEAELNESLVIR
ncbi:O-antigen ligase [Pseudomonas indica]|uniref:O-antigen ligase n=1 Tax=Pseudomonas indica TaxID=137658 RepID=A0A1G8YUQ2_9PSED|nr:O-antigen ligase [Pseudomonas indica]